MNDASGTTAQRAWTRGDFAAVASLGALALIFFSRVLFTDQALFWGDIILGFYPAYDVWTRAVASGHLPLWNPFIFNGAPHLADAEFSTFYPSMLLNLVLPLHRALAADLALHVFLMAAFTYAFLRRERLPLFAALLGAVTFAFSGFVAVRITQLNLLRTITWLPLLLLTVQDLERVGQRALKVLAVGVLLSLQVLAGHLQSFLISSLLVGAYGVWRGFEEGARRGLRRSVALAGLLAAGAGVAFLLSAVQILPGIELVGHSDRQGGTSLNLANTFALPPRQLPLLVAPNLFGHPADFYWGEWVYSEMIGYAGVGAVLLGVLGLLLSARRDRWFWGAIGALGVILALGNGTPLFPLVYRLVPGVAYFRVPSRFLLWFVWGASVLAAYGSGWLLSERPAGRAWRAMALLMLVGGAAALYWAAGGPGVLRVMNTLTEWAASPSRVLSPAAIRELLAYADAVIIEQGRYFALVWIGTALVIAGARSRRLRPAVAAALLLLLAVGDLFAYGMGFYPTVPARELSRRVPTDELLDLDRGAYRLLTQPAFANGLLFTIMRGSFKGSGPTTVHAFRAAFVPNIGVERQVANVIGYSPITLPPTDAVIRLASSDAQARGGRAPLIDFMSARFILTRGDAALAHRKVYDDEFLAVWRNDHALPRGVLVTRYAVPPAGDTALGQMVTPWDPKREVILERAPRETFGLRPVNDPGRITGRHYEPTRASFTLDLRAPAIFVLSDTYYPGWKAYIDGVEHPIHRANHAFRAVFLPPGARHLEFLYQPKGVVVGGIISAVGWLAVLVTLAAGAVKRGAS